MFPGWRRGWPYSREPAVLDRAEHPQDVSGSEQPGDDRSRLQLRLAGIDGSPAATGPRSTRLDRIFQLARQRQVSSHRWQRLESVRRRHDGIPHQHSGVRIGGGVPLQPADHPFGRRDADADNGDGNHVGVELPPDQELCAYTRRPRQNGARACVISDVVSRRRAAKLRAVVHVRRPDRHVLAHEHHAIRAVRELQHHARCECERDAADGAPHRQGGILSESRPQIPEQPGACQRLDQFSKRCVQPVRYWVPVCECGDWCLSDVLAGGAVGQRQLCLQQSRVVRAG
jgi:hypothetical protein